MRSLIFLSLAALSAAAAVDTSVAPLPIGEVGWEGVVVPGQPPIQVWGDSFEVGLSFPVQVKMQSRVSSTDVPFPGH